MRAAAPAWVSSPTLDEWWAGPYEQHQGRHDALHEVGQDGAWADVAELLEPGRLATLHARACEQDGAPANAAAKWVASWTVGPVAAAIGFALATTGAGVLAGTGQLRVRLNPDGWPERVDLRGSQALVPTGHPWERTPGVEVASAEDLLRRTREALVAVAAPFVTALRPLGRVGATALWAEVADDIGLCLTHAPALTVTDDMVTRLAGLLDLPGSPWRRRPDLRAAKVLDVDACLARKAGCCLAYLVPGDDVDLDGEGLTERQSAWYARYPPGDEQRRTCTTCSLRDLADCEDRQRFWFELNASFE